MHAPRSSRPRCAARPASATRLLLLLVALAWVPIGAQQEVTPTADDLFSDEVVHDLRLFMHSGDWELLQARYMENTYYPVDVEWNGLVVRNAAVRSRGTGSRDSRKPALKVDFNEFVSGQTFLGLKSLVLDNFRQDPGMVKELVSMELYRRVGQAAPRAAHARVFVNNEYIGLYAMLEPIDKTFLKTWLGEDDGHLYEFNWSGNWYFEWLGSDLRPYAAMFEPKTREDDPPETLHRPIEALVEAANHASRTSWEPLVRQYLELDALLRYVAVETYLADHDGFAGDWGLNNFYVYRSPETGRLLFLPWDKDVNFREPGRGIFDGFEQNVLLSTVLATAHLRAIYVDALRRCAAVADEPPPGGEGPGWLQREIARQTGLIREAAHEDQRKAYTNARFEQEVAWMIEFARRRGGEVLHQLRQE